MPVKMTSAQPATWPSHLSPPGAGAPKEKPWARYRAAKDAAVARQRMKQEMERAAVTGREMEATLIAEAEEEVRLRRWRRRQLEAARDE